MQQQITEHNTVTARRSSADEYRATPAPRGPQVSHLSISANILSILLLRISSRVSFVLLGFYLGEHFSSAAAVALILEAFYITELFLSPIAGSLTDRLGRKPFLLLAPVIGASAATCFLVASYLFPHPNGHHLDLALFTLLGLVLFGRLLEGCATAVGTPASLGYITDTTSHSMKLRGRVMTAFEVATVGGLALAIPLGGRISSMVGTAGFLFVIAVYLLNALLIASVIKESQLQKSEQRQSSPLESLKLLRSKRISTFLPAWLCINTLVGAWITLITIMLAYPKAQAVLRHPHQLLYGGFSKDSATLLLGGFGLLFLLGMGLWLLALPYLRRSTIMCLGLAGLALCIVALTLINGLAQSLPELKAAGQGGMLFLLLPPVILGVILLSGFSPASLTQMAAIAETQPGKRGAVMGLYSVVMGLGQLVGASIGGLFVDMGGFYGLMIFSTLLGLISLASVLYMRYHGFDRDSALRAETSKLPALAKGRH